jgi:hypothetical protein
MSRDHVRIYGLGAEPRSVLNAATAADPQVLAITRWYFASAILQHLAVKERYVYAKLEHDPRPEVIAYFHASKADLVRRFASYTERMEEWPTAKGVQQWPMYRLKAIAVVGTFIERFKWEETDLLSFVARHKIDISEPAAVTSNWVRKALDIKNSLEMR